MAWTPKHTEQFNRLSKIYIAIFLLAAVGAVAGLIPNETVRILLAVAFVAQSYVLYQVQLAPKMDCRKRLIATALIALLPCASFFVMRPGATFYLTVCLWSIVYAITMFFIVIIYLSLYKNKSYMRKKIVAGNWKMNTTPAEGVELAKAVVANASQVKEEVEFIVCPPFTHLSEVAKATAGTRVNVGAQNCAAEEKGAYTGEVSAQMIASLGMQYVILGHSERRQYYGETSETLNCKMKQAYANNLIPIYCVGENLDEREAGNHFDVVKAQIEEVVFNLSEEQFEKLVIAYEPVWAIGTGKTATADQAQEIHAFIRKTLSAKFGTAANNTAILYGGSCKPSNAAEIFAKEDVDGGLIGGAALKAEDFIAIGKAF